MRIEQNGESLPQWEPEKDWNTAEAKSGGSRDLCGGTVRLRAARCVTYSGETATCCKFCSNLKEESAMVKNWLIIGFLLASFFIFLVVFGNDIMDYDPRWDDEIDVREKEDEQQ